MLCSTVLYVPHSLFPALIGINLSVGPRVLMMRSIPWSWISLLPAFLQGHVQLSHAVAAAVLAWHNYRLLFTCEWAVRVDCHVVIIPSVVLRLCMYCEASRTSTSLCWWTKKRIALFQKSPSILQKRFWCVPPNLVRLRSCSKDFATYHKIGLDSISKMFLQIRRQGASGNFHSVLRATLLVTVRSWFSDTCDLTWVQMISVASLTSINNYPWNLDILNAFWTLTGQHGGTVGSAVTSTSTST